MSESTGSEAKVIAPPTIEPADGRLAVFLVGLGAIATTLVAGVERVRQGLDKPIGSLSQLGTVRIGRRDEGDVRTIQSLVPLTSLDNLDFHAWDPFPDDAYVAAQRAGVLNVETLEKETGEYLRSIRPEKAVFNHKMVRMIDGPSVRDDKTFLDSVKGLQEDIQRFMNEKGSARAVMVWCGSTEALLPDTGIYHSLEAFEEALAGNETTEPAISPTMIYAYAALSLGIPFINCSPNLSVDLPALVTLAEEKKAALAGKDLKTGQTLVKTALAPMFKSRLLGLDGWFSTNILGNRDGEVLQDPDSFLAKQQSKLGVLENILEPELYPDLYGHLDHLVNINYYPPRGDNKEGWDNIDIVGWLGYPMQMKINFLCRDSILAAPLVLDLILFADLAQRSKMWGIQEWLSFYFKSPQSAPNIKPEHDLFIQGMKLKNTLRFLSGQEPINHLGIEYYNYFT